MDKSRIAIVIPALNEARTITPIIEGVKEYGTVIVVNDGSTDDTEELSEKAGAEVVTHSRNIGYDMALYSGFSRAAELGKEFIVSIDADGQHNPKDMLEMLKVICTGESKLALAYRDKPARVAEYLFRIVAKRQYGINDILCGLKAFHVDLFREYGHIMKAQTMGTGLAIRSIKAGNKPIQVPISVKNRLDSPRIGRIFKANLRILNGMLLALTWRTSSRRVGGVPQPPVR